MKNSNHSIVLPGNHVETVAEAEAMLNAVSQDALLATDLKDKSDLESLHCWLVENINSQLSGSK